MKKYLITLSLVVLMSVVLFSCGGDEEEVEPKKKTRTLTFELKQTGGTNCTKRINVIDRYNGTPYLDATQTTTTKTYSIEAETGKTLYISITSTYADCQGTIELVIKSNGVELEKHQAGAVFSRSIYVD